ncbi:G2/mitotic-specific cyclin-4 [Sarocladium implicatum]|nr:G2/mitotic-specific cyclin-4 [Sarocladium implicatum]
MDAKPCRPRRDENAASILHQRHKSTGNLKAMVSNPLTGFRGPAKRAAFGDLTNVAKNTGTASSVKMVKPFAGTFNQSSNTKLLNKENAPFGSKNAVSENTEKPALQPARATAVFESRPLNADMRPATSAAHDLPSLQEQTIEEEPQALVDAQEGQELAEEPPRAPLHSNVLRPRQHKSQPDLKARKQTLRRTQSRVIERPQTVAEAPEGDILVLDNVEILPPQAEDLPEPASTETLSAEAEASEPTSATYDDQVPDDNDDAALLDQILSREQGSLPSRFELEECWAEDDEDDYDDDFGAFDAFDETTGIPAVMQPKVTARVQRELEDAKLEVQRTRTFDDIEEETWDVSMVAEYGDEIFEYMRDLEIRMLPNPHYMDVQTEIQWTMRSVLMDWLVQVHNRFCLLPETLFLTVNYIDRFLSNKVVSIGKLQLVGATAILLASKYEEINCPSLSEIIYMVDGGYTTDEILKAERFMLTMLHFELGWPGPMSFLRRVSKADDYDLDTRTVAKYFLELTIMDERFVASPPSFLAAAAHCLSRLILRKGDWTKAHIYYSGYTFSQLRPVVQVMFECCQSPHLHHKAIFDKYCEKRFKEAAIVVQQEIEDGFTLPRPSHRRSTRSQPAFHLDTTAEMFQSPNQVMVPTEG